MIEIFLIVLALYFGVGLLFAVPFVLKGARVIDPAAVEGSWGFKFFIIPGVAVFWPLLLKRWLKGESAPEEKSAHRASH